jgi:HD-GYP domain-containing protein (c-di-GMP phosphodiesterase class II)
LFTNVRSIARHEPPSNVVHTLIGAVAAHHAGTSEHLAETAGLAARIAARMGLDEATIQNCRLGALLHDVGMLGVDTGILEQPSMLADPDFDLISEHPALGEEMLLSIPSLAHLAPIVRGHHERMDGSGYPDGLIGREIPIECRIIAVADAYHVMTSGVPYRDPRPFSATSALAELLGNSDSQFDHQAVQAFEAITGRRTRKLRG